MQGGLSLHRRDSQTAVLDDLEYDYYTGTNRLRNTDEADGDNYTYDGIGNLISDESEGIENIDWTPYGKVRFVLKEDASEIHFRYDASGNRIAKITDGDTTVYVRDASEDRPLKNSPVDYFREGPGCRVAWACIRTIRLLSSRFMEVLAWVY